jgi:hypothetical protein
MLSEDLDMAIPIASAPAAAAKPIVRAAAIALKEAVLSTCCSGAAVGSGSCAFAIVHRQATAVSMINMVIKSFLIIIPPCYLCGLDASPYDDDASITKTYV